MKDGSLLQHLNHYLQYPHTMSKCLIQVLAILNPITLPDNAQAWMQQVMAQVLVYPAIHVRDPD